MRNGQEDVCINLLGNLLDASKEKGKLEQKKEELEFLKDFEYLRNKREILENRIKQLQKEIDSQTEQNSDKEVAQPYSKSDTTTKEIGSNSK